jgi:transposase InsO family protein
MDNVHGNARSSPIGRVLTVELVLIHGFTRRAAAAARGVNEKTVRRWIKRYLAEGIPDRLRDLSSVPHRQPKRTARSLERSVCSLRRLRMSYSQIAMFVPLSRATIYRILKRHGLNKLSLLGAPKPPPVRYERDHPGDLLHLDMKKLTRFHKPGVRGTGNRADRNQGAGNEALHVAIDDHSRLGYACVFDDEKIPSVLTALRQAICFYASHGIKIKRILTDNGPAYISHAFHHECSKLGIKHKLTRRYRPQTNGKAERFIQTLTREWAYAKSYHSSFERNAYLLDYINIYNWTRPHTSLNFHPPISRLSKSAANVSRYYS